MASKLAPWVAFSLVAFAFGSSFLWVKIAIRELPPFTLVGFRLLFGLAGLVPVLWWQRQRVPRDRRVLAAYVGVAVFNTALPFALIAWGQTRIDSAVAAILIGTMPLFTIVIAHVWLENEGITAPRLLGLVIGFAGVVVLVSRDLGWRGLGAGVIGQAAVLAAAASYAVAAIFARKYLRGQPAVAQATMVILIADVLVWSGALATERPLHLPEQTLTWAALLWLGPFGSCIAYLLYFYLIKAWDATRAATVNYASPVVGLVLGIVFLGEIADWRLLVGSALVMAGIAATNARPRPARALAVRSLETTRVAP